MALFSVKNFIAPLQNRVHLFAILMGALAFAIFRFSGGAMVTIPEAQYEQYKKMSPGERGSEDLANKVRTKFTESISKRQEQDPLVEVLQEHDQQKEELESRAAAKAAGKQGPLDDIERSLGLK